MSLNTIAQAAQDGDLAQRIRACAAQEGHPDPVGFTARHMWAVAAAPDIAEAYAYAVDNTPAYTTREYGQDPAIVSDVMILAAVQPLVQADLPTSEE